MNKLLQAYEKDYLNKLELKWGGLTKFYEKIDKPAWEWETYIDINIPGNCIIFKSNGQVISIENNLYHDIYNYLGYTEYYRMKNIHLETKIKDLEKITIEKALQIFEKNEPIFFKKWLLIK